MPWCNHDWTRILAILIFDDVEVLDFCGPFEVFSVANRFTEPPAFNVLTVAEKAGPVVNRGGLSVNSHHRLARPPEPTENALTPPTKEARLNATCP